MEPPFRAINSFTSSQRQFLKRREAALDKEAVQKLNLKPEALDPAFAENMRMQQSAQAATAIPAAQKKAAEEVRMRKLREGDYSGPTLDSSRYLSLRNAQVEGNPRQTEAYRALCREAVGVGEKPDR